MGENILHEYSLISNYTHPQPKLSREKIKNPALVKNNLFSLEI